MPDQTAPARLQGAVVVLIASPPDSPIDERELPESAIIENDDAEAAVDEAAIALARAVLAEGGTLAVKGDAYAAPLVAQIASEYWAPPPIETAEAIPPPAVLIYGGDSAFSELVGRAPMVSPALADAIAPAAVVLVGGGAEELRESSGWRERMRSGLFFAIPSSGGAAADSESPLERNLVRRLNGLRRERQMPETPERSDEPQEEDSRQFAFSHYPLLMRQIVDEIILWWNERGRR